MHEKWKLECSRNEEDSFSRALLLPIFCSLCVGRLWEEMIFDSRSVQVYAVVLFDVGKGKFNQVEDMELLL